MPDVKYGEALKRLEKIVEQLEEPDLPLEARLKKFEEGTKLSRELFKKLDQAKKKVEVLVEGQDSQLMSAPFDEASEDDPEFE